MPAEAEWHWVGAVPSRGLAVATFGVTSAPLGSPRRRPPAAGRSAPGPAGSTRSASGPARPPAAPPPTWRRCGAASRRTRSLAGSAGATDPGRRLQHHGPGSTAAAFRRLVDQLGELGLRSAYHAYFGEPFGAETRATYFHHRHEARPFHIDFCFLSDDLLARVTHVEVGTWAAWVDRSGAAVSDHVPLVVDLAPEPPALTRRAVQDGLTRSARAASVPLVGVAGWRAVAAGNPPAGARGRFEAAAHVGRHVVGVLEAGRQADRARAEIPHASSSSGSRPAWELEAGWPTSVSGPPSDGATRHRVERLEERPGRLLAAGEIEGHEAAEVAELAAGEVGLGVGVEARVADPADPAVGFSACATASAVADCWRRRTPSVRRPRRPFSASKGEAWRPAARRSPRSSR